MAMTHTRAKGQGQSSLGSNVRVETDVRAEAIGLHPVLARSVMINIVWSFVRRISGVFPCVCWSARASVQKFAGVTELQVVSTARLSVAIDQTKLDNDLLKVAWINQSINQSVTYSSVDAWIKQQVKCNRIHKVDNLQRPLNKFYRTVDVHR